MPFSRAVKIKVFSVFSEMLVFKRAEILSLGNCKNKMGKELKNSKGNYSDILLSYCNFCSAKEFAKNGNLFSSLNCTYVWLIAFESWMYTDHIVEAS